MELSLLVSFLKAKFGSESDIPEMESLVSFGPLRWDIMYVSGCFREEEGDRYRELEEKVTRLQSQLEEKQCPQLFSRTQSLK